MSARLSEANHIAGLLLIANRHLARGGTAEAAAALIGVPVSTLREWREQLARAEVRQTRRLRKTAPACPAFHPDL